MPNCQFQIDIDGSPSAVPPGQTTSPPVGAEPGVHDRFFRTDHLMADLKGRSLRGGAATLGAQGGAVALKLGSIAVLARLLTPADFGLIAMVTVVTGFVEMFKDAGLSTATVQRARVTHQQVSTLFWINVGLSVVLMLIVAAMAPGVAWFYRQPELTAVTMALAGTFIIGGLTIQHQALMRRQMMFGTLAAIGIVSQAVGIAAAIAAAAFGARYWALVAMTAASALANAALVWIYCPWRPAMPVRGAGVRPMLAFGGNHSGFEFINYWARNADNMLIGWYWGAGALGLYSRAYSLMLLPMSQIKNPISAVALPVLSRLQNEPEEFARYYLKAVNAMMWLCGPLVALLASRADLVVLIVLGEQWLPAVAVFRILAVTAFLQPVYSTIGWVFLGCGRARRMMRWATIACPIMVGSFVVGLPYGPVGVAASYSIAFVAILPWTLSYTFADTRLTVRDLARHLLAPAAVSFLIFAVVSLAEPLTASQAAVVQACVSFGVAVLVFLAACLAVPLVRSECRELLAIVRGIRPQRAPSV